MPETAKHSLWADLAKYIASAVVGAIFAAFVLGRNAQKINDVVHWKTEVAPRIERMDRQGTLSFELFHERYKQEQSQQYDRLKDLENKMGARIAPERILKMETEINHLDQMELRIERLEKKVGEDP
jgi:hypothetical protein